jgi:hypothetical protein
MIKLLQSETQANKIDNKMTTISILKQAIRLINELTGMSQDMKFNELYTEYTKKCDDVFLNAQIQKVYYEKTQTVVTLFNDELELYDEDMDFLSY